MSRFRRPRKELPPRSQSIPGSPPVIVANPDDSVRQLWYSRIAQCVQDTYAGAPLCKLAEDLRVYEHLLWAARPRVVIEIGAYGGGSALWFRDRLRTMESYGRVADTLVVSVEIEPAQALQALDAADPEWRSSIHLVGGDVCDPATAERVAELVPADAAVLVVEDSAHVYDTTLAALTNFSHFVQPGGYFVVEDGCVDVEELRLQPDWPRGVLPALHDWLRTEPGREFEVRRELEFYGLTGNPHGYLQRKGP